MEKISGGHLVARALKTEGVEAVFTLCGGHVIAVYDSCLDVGSPQELGHVGIMKPITKSRT